MRTRKSISTRKTAKADDTADDSDLTIYANSSDTPVKILRKKINSDECEYMKIYTWYNVFLPASAKDDATILTLEKATRIIDNYRSNIIETDIYEYVIEFIN